MVLKKILCILLFIFFHSQVLAKDWKPNQVGSFLSSKIARSITDINNAAYYAQYSYNRNPESSGLGIIALEALLANGQVKEAIPIGVKISNDFPELTLSQYIKALDSLATNKEAALEILLKVSPNGIDTYILPILQTWAAAGSNKQLGGLKIMKDQAERGVLEPLYDYHSALINEFTGDIQSAKINYINIVNKSRNASAQIYLEAALFFHKNNNKELFDNTIAKLERIAPYSNELFLLKNNIFLTNEKKIKNIKQGIAETFLNSAEILFNEGLDRQALIYGQLSLYLSPNLDNASYLLGRIFKSINDNERAMKYLKKINNKSYISQDAKIAYAEIIFDSDGIDSAVTILEEYHLLYPDNINFSRTIAELYYKADNFEKSIEYYDLIFSKIEEIEFKHWPLFYSSGIALERGKKWKRAEKQFLMALKFVPDNPQVLNYLGYSWIDKGVNINEAMGMIVKAAEKRPDDGYIIDSLGWAFYQTGEYELAVINLEKAVELVSDSIIIDHLGDALFYSGRKLEAIFQWKRALEFDPTNELINIIEDKINGKLIPKAGINASSKPI
jgi:tetratricopeptide (TPR) repeat protein